MWAWNVIDVLTIVFAIVAAVVLPIGMVLVMAERVRSRQRMLEMSLEPPDPSRESNSRSDERARAAPRS